MNLEEGHSTIVLLTFGPVNPMLLAGGAVRCLVGYVVASLATHSPVMTNKNASRPCQLSPGGGVHPRIFQPPSLRTTDPEPGVSF